MIGLTPEINMTHVAVVRHGVLRLRFADGVVGEVDVLERMRQRLVQRRRGSFEAELGSVQSRLHGPEFGMQDVAVRRFGRRLQRGAGPRIAAR